MSREFFSRWSRLKAGETVEPELKPTKLPEKKAETQTEETKINLEGESEIRLPNLEDVAKIDNKASDFSAFMQPEVDPSVQQAALKKMFSDPHFNIMDGLDEYIDDYSKPDPIPLAMLKRMVQSQTLNLFGKDEKTVKEGVDSPKEGDSNVNSQSDAIKENQTLANNQQTDLISLNPNHHSAVEQSPNIDPAELNKKTS